MSQSQGESRPDEASASSKPPAPPAVRSEDRFVPLPDTPESRFFFEPIDAPESPTPVKLAGDTWIENPEEMRKHLEQHPDVPASLPISTPNEVLSLDTSTHGEPHVIPVQPSDSSLSSTQTPVCENSPPATVDDSQPIIESPSTQEFSTYHIEHVRESNPERANSSHSASDESSRQHQMRREGTMPSLPTSDPDIPQASVPLQVAGEASFPPSDPARVGSSPPTRPDFDFANLATSSAANPTPPHDGLDLGITLDPSAVASTASNDLGSGSFEFLNQLNVPTAPTRQPLSSTEAMFAQQGGPAGVSSAADANLNESSSPNSYMSDDDLEIAPPARSGPPSWVLIALANYASIMTILCIYFYVQWSRTTSIQSVDEIVGQETPGVPDIPLKR